MIMKVFNYWTIDDSGNVHNIRKSSECLIKIPDVFESIIF